MSIYVKNILRFIIIMLIQQLILNQIHLRLWGNETGGAPPFIPLLYPIIILLLPISTSKNYTLLLGFLAGLTVDIFMDTGGMHAAASLIMAFARNTILAMILPTKIEDFKGEEPGRKNLNFNGFLVYGLILFGIHHLVYYIQEIWSFRYMSYFLLKFFATLITSFIFLFIYISLFDKKSK